MKIISILFLTGLLFLGSTAHSAPDYKLTDKHINMSAQCAGALTMVFHGIKALFQTRPMIQMPLKMSTFKTNALPVAITTCGFYWLYEITRQYQQS